MMQQMFQLYCNIWTKISWKEKKALEKKLTKKELKQMEIVD